MDDTQRMVRIYLFIYVFHSRHFSSENVKNQLLKRSGFRKTKVYEIMFMENALHCRLQPLVYIQLIRMLLFSYCMLFQQYVM